MESVQSQASDASNTLARPGVSGRWLLLSVLLGLFALVAWLGQRSVTSTLQQQVENSLVTILKADVKALTIWLEHEQQTVLALSRQTELQQELLHIISNSRSRLDHELINHPRLAAVQQMLAPVVESHEALLFLVTDQSGRYVASSPNFALGTRLPPDYSTAYERVWQAETVVLPPHHSQLAIPVNQQQPKLDVPVILVAGPIRDQSDQVVGSLSLVFHPSDQFTDVLSVARSGQSGETYAVDQHARMLSESRFEPQLRRIGLLKADESSALEISVHNPGGNMTLGYQPPLDPAAQPMTYSAACLAAAAQTSDRRIQSRVTAFLDYRGVPVVGAWQWLPDYDFGVITEVDYADAFAPTRRLSYILWAFIATSALAVSGLVFYSWFAQGVWQRLQRAERELEKLGQYELVEKIGSGGMGEVHRARHSMLRRDCAIKLLRPTAANATAISRFEREVQATSQLQNPHTIQIFDYGRTPDGTFYYAMEFLDGIDLDHLVAGDGCLSDGRVRNTLMQVCQSLREAHRNNLVHRDIKPSNIMLCHRGGVSDTVKVLDFGLVRSLAADSHRTVTSDGSIAGTPAFMSPEGSQTPNAVDARSDIYSLGCVIYFLLSGKAPLEGQNPIETCWKHVRETPVPIQQVAAQPVAQSLAELTMQCLAKSPDERPQSADALWTALHSISPLSPWTNRQADQWWSKYISEPNPQRTHAQDTARSAAQATDKFHP